MRRTALIAGASVALLVLLLRRTGIREDLEWETVTKPGRIIDIDGYGVHVVEHGSGPAIVFIHGFGGQTYSYRHLIPAFARDHRVVAVDLKGYGYSERNAEAGLSHTDQVAMLRSLLERLGIDRATFVGHSMGGFVVQRMAATHPDAVESLVLAASVSADRRRVERMRRIPLLPKFLVRPLMPTLARITASRILRLSYHDPAVLTEQVAEEYVRPVRIKGSMEGLLAMTRESLREDAPIDFSSITQPVLLLYGAHDRIVALRVAGELQEQLPQARLVVIDNAGHLLLEERPEECIAAIRDFLSQTRDVGAEAMAR